MSEHTHRQHHDSDSSRRRSHPREEIIEIPHHRHRCDDASPRRLSRSDHRSRTFDIEGLSHQPHHHHHSPRGRELILSERQRPSRSPSSPHHRHTLESSDRTLDGSSREHHHREIAFTDSEKAERREARKKRREKEERLEKAGLSWKQTAHNGGWIGCEVLGAVADGF